MKYCIHCGAELLDEASICPKCGCSCETKKEKSSDSTSVKTNTDDGSAVWLVLGIFVPLAGLILYLVWKDDKPKCSLQAGKGALIGVLFPIIAFFSCLIIVFLLSLTGCGSLFFWWF